MPAEPWRQTSADRRHPNHVHARSLLLLIVVPLLRVAALLLLLLSSARAVAAAFTTTTRTLPPLPGRGRGGIPLTTCRGSGATLSGRRPRPRPIARPSTVPLLVSPSSPSSSSSDDDASSTATTKQKKKSRRRTAILLCLAQFCVPADYAAILDDIFVLFSASSCCLWL